MYKWAVIISLLVFSFNAGCTASQYIWPQSDMNLYEISLSFDLLEAMQCHTIYSEISYAKIEYWLWATAR